MLANGYSLAMVRGDSEKITVSCNQRNFADGDVLEFTVVQSLSTRTILIHKIVDTFENGKAIVSLEPNDTSSLNAGGYKYDVQVTFTDIGVKTIIKPSDFVIMEGCT